MGNKSNAKKVPFSSPEGNFATDKQFPVNLGKAAFIFPQDNYVKNVVPKPELLQEDDFSYTLRYSLFAETFIKPRATSLDRTEVVQASLISRSLIQPTGTLKKKLPADYSINNSEYYNQVFYWNILWLPTISNSSCEVYSIQDIEASKDFFSIPTSIDIGKINPSKVGFYDKPSDHSDKSNLKNLASVDEVPKVPFILRKGSESNTVVLRVGTPIFDIKVKK